MHTIRTWKIGLKLKWGKVVKNEPIKICGRQPLRKLNWYGLLADHITSNFLNAVFILLGPFLNTLPQIFLLFNSIIASDFSYSVLNWSLFYQLRSPYVLYQKIFFCYLASYFLTSFRFQCELTDCLWSSIEHLRGCKSSRP